MLVDIFNGNDLIHTYDLQTENETIAEKTAHDLAETDQLDFTHTAFRDLDGHRQLTLWDL